MKEEMSKSWNTIRILNGFSMLESAKDIVILNLYTLLITDACKGNFGVFPNPVDPTCSTFVQCSWSEPYVRDCNPGYLFNAKTKKCDFPNNVECEINPPRLTEKDQKALVLNPGPVDGLKRKSQPKIVCYYPNYSYWRKGLF